MRLKSCDLTSSSYRLSRVKLRYSGFAFGCCAQSFKRAGTSPALGLGMDKANTSGNIDVVTEE